MATFFHWSTADDEDEEEDGDALLTNAAHDLLQLLMPLSSLASTIQVYFLLLYIFL